MPLSAPPVVAAMVEIEAHFVNLGHDLELLKGFVDRGYQWDKVAYAALSAQLYASELIGRLVKLQIALAEEGAK